MNPQIAQIYADFENEERERKEGFGITDYTDYRDSGKREEEKEKSH
ncbi:hypothetical protein HZA56_10235 [Candidatus Poribacteria bacterium]|nr:hypothetical protein [Candidatus Poribacteria bacterium]